MARQSVWDISSIKEGIEAFYNEHGRYPTALDFDETTYLPSARQVQRAYGGLQNLREQLGYNEVNYTRGSARSADAYQLGVRGLAAENGLEQILVDYFGEPYVHTQKRYYTKLKNRWDFFVYYHGGYIGIDIFTTTRPSLIMRNINHKLSKYADVPLSVPIYFVVDDNGLIGDQAIQRTLPASLRQRSNITVVSLSAFVTTVIPNLPPLQLPIGIKLLIPSEHNIEQN